jgi:hypothetical protein
MNVTEVSQLIDQLVFQRTGKHLDDVQKAVVEGTWKRQTYDDIAKECNVTKNHASDVGSELWKLLSDAFGEEIKKSNFRSSIERMKVKSSPNSLNVVNSNNNHFCHT